MVHKFHMLQYLRLLSRENSNAAWKFLEEHEALVFSAPGSAHNHQVWEGGYADHVVEVMQIADKLHDALSEIRPLPFYLADAILVLFLHDIEKPFKKGIPAENWTKQARSLIRKEIVLKYGFVLTEEQANALKYVEGEGDDYRGDRRVMNELAAFCHMCDVASARIWYDEPRATQQAQAILDGNEDGTIPTERRGDPCPSCGALASEMKTDPVTWRYNHSELCEVGVLTRRLGVLSNPPSPANEYVCSANPAHKHLMTEPGPFLGQRECPFCWAEFAIK